MNTGLYINDATHAEQILLNVFVTLHYKAHRKSSVIIILAS
jgi:hypothetical protein